MTQSDKSAKTIKVMDVMTRDPITVSPEVAVEQVMAVMQQASIRHVPVVDEQGLMGVVSERDLQFVHRVPGLYEELGEKDVQEVLAAPVGVVLKSRFLLERDVLTVRFDEMLSRAVDLFVATGVGMLPVVDDEEQLVGVLSVVDVLRWVGDEVLEP